MSDRIELLRALAVLSERPDDAHAELGRALGISVPPTREEHTQLFSLSVYPYASVYVGSEGMLGGEARSRVAGFWSALGYEPPVEPDHVAALLGLYATLIEAEAAESDPARRLLQGQARAALLHEHLVPWLPVFLDKISEGSGFYARWASLLLEVLTDEVRAEPPQEVPALHLREAPALPGIEEGIDELLRSLLAPVRSGIVIAPQDLFRCARHLELGTRIGERAFMLRSLLAQDGEAVAGWLGGYASDRVERYRRLRSRFGRAMDHWMERADAARALLLDVQRAAREVVVSGAGS